VSATVDVETKEVKAKLLSKATFFVIQMTFDKPMNRI
jgi:hypothetical protein